MQYYIISDTKTLCLERGGKTIHIKLRHPQPQLKRVRTTEGKIEDVLEVAQDYLNSLPTESQDLYWNHIEWIYNNRYLYTKMLTMDQVIELHRESIAKMVTTPGINMDDIFDWVCKNLRIPSSIEGSFDKKQARVNGHSRAQTYISTEYQWLNTLAIMVKLLAPYGAIFTGIEATMWIGNRNIPMEKINEYLVYKVYPQWFRDSEPFHKLVAFVERRKRVNSIPGYKVIDNFVSDESIVRHIVASLISRLVVSPVKRIAGKKNLVATLYSTLEGHFKPERKKDIRTKITTSTDTSGELDKSVIETYKDRSRYFIHEQAILTHVADFENALKPYKSQVVMSEVRQIYKDLLATEDMVFTKIQECICANTLRWVISPDIYGLLTYDQLKGLLAIASYLLKDKHPELSLLCLSGAEHMRDEYGVLDPQRSSVNTVSGTRFLDLIAAYPIRCTTIKFNNDISVTVKDNIVVNYIREMASYTPYHWIPVTSDPAYDSIIVKEDGKRRIRPMPDIQILLGNFLSDLDNIGCIPGDLLQKALQGELEI